MGRQSARPPKKRGPPATGKGKPILVRLQPAQLAALDAWIARQDAQLSCPGARSIAAAQVTKKLDRRLSTWLPRSWTGLTACRHCPLKSQCAKANERRIKRWELEHVLEAVQQRLDKNRWRCAKGARQLSGLDHYAPNRHDTGSTTARSVDEVALIRDTISHYAPVLIASARATAQLGLVWSPATGINFFVTSSRVCLCSPAF